MNPSLILEKIRNLKVLVIGDLILDHYIWGDVNRISPEAPVPVVHATHDTYAAGGAANVALNLASLGVNASVIGVIGANGHANLLREILENASIDTTGCQCRDSAATIVKTRVISRNQQLCRIDREDGRAEYALVHTQGGFDRVARAISEADAVIFSDYAKGVITQNLLDFAIPVARNSNTFIALDPKPSRRMAFHGVDLITPNRHEALELVHLPEPSRGEAYPLAEIARKIHEAHAPVNLVVTLGADGMAICRNGNIGCVLPTRAREVFDVSGAGDTVIATLTAALAAGADAESAAHFANLAAGDVVSKMGTAVPSATAWSE
ncbi:MAG: bifunctional heptose 7-phosphate kinase/heptose 1-phosphate adenyltransferase [Luteolibacter sp.]